MHFAALKSVKESVEKPLEYYRNNVGSILTVLELMPLYGIKDFNFSSSCTVYGQPDQIPVDENSPFKPAESPYGATKQMGEQILKDVHKLGYRVVSLRYFNPIGAHPSAHIGEMSFGGPPNYLVPYIVETAVRIREKLTVFGNDYNTPDGFCIRDYIHVVDIAKAHVKALQYLEQASDQRLYEYFNLGTGEGTSVLELINKVIPATGVDIPCVIGPRRPGDIEKVYADPTTANKQLGWSTELSMEDALKHAWEWQKVLTARGKK
jgi:UDP-glucose 4-epimerase